MICLDSCFLIDVLRHKPKAIEKWENIDKNLTAITIINLYELMSGIYAVKDRNYEKHLGILKELVAHIPVFQLDSFSVKQASKISGELSLKGQIIDELDVLIAGICLSNGCNVIITNNVNHFSRIKGLKVEGY